MLFRGLAQSTIHALDARFANLDPRIATTYFNFLLVVWGSKCRLRQSGNRFVLEHGDGSWLLPNPLRSSWYRRGFSARARELSESYSIATIISSLESPIVIDCGANTGDIASCLPKGSKYFGFEPDPEAYNCLETNVEKLAIDVKIFKIGLSNYCGEGQLFLSTAGGDSSLVRPSHSTAAVGIEVATLDSIVKRIGIIAIDILKIEAEGGEPEVLEGAAYTLAITDYVAVDAGPERSGFDTLPEVSRLLASAGFEMTGSISKKGRFLFARRGLTPRVSPRFQ